MSTPFTAQALLTYPDDDGESASDHSNVVSSSYTELATAKLVLTGASTHSVNFGSIAVEGALAIQIDVAVGNAAPIMAEFNGNTPGLEVAAGGHIQYCNPTPTALGVLSLDIVHTVDSTVWVRILG